jgi:transposase InsO family protein
VTETSLLSIAGVTIAMTNCLHWQNGYAERLIGSIRRECLDHVVVLGERHLRHVLSCYMEYYNATRTHLSLGKDAPITRAIQSIGHLQCRPVLGGLHHRYVRV